MTTHSQDNPDDHATVAMQAHASSQSSAEEEAGEAGDHTVAVVRAEAEDDATIAIGPRPTASEGTAPSDDTIALTRAPFSPPSEEEGADTTIGVTRTGRGSRLARPDPRHRRRGITPPPVPEGFAPLPVEGLGPWGVEEYPARVIAPAPTARSISTDGPSARTSDPSLRSVTLHARRSARRATTVFILSCMLVVAGFVALGWWLIR
jgi:hypothetical protein